MLNVVVREESFPIAGAFTISRGSKTSADVIVVELQTESAVGRGECVPYTRYGESIASVRQQLDAVLPSIPDLQSPQQSSSVLPAGAARNALDCALWDVQAKCSGVAVHERLGLDPLKAVTTAFTLSLATAHQMGEAARREADRPILKLKLAGDSQDIERVTAVRAGAQDASLIVDANEGGTVDSVGDLLKHLAQLRVALVEQPVPADADEGLADIDHAVPLCADESCHTSADIPRLAQRYDAVNIKLDKAGGLTEALSLHQQARNAGLQVMVGCMVGTSLAMAPALLLAQQAQFVDLDGPLLLARDRDPGLSFSGSLIHPPPPQLWG